MTTLTFLADTASGQIGYKNSTTGVPQQIETNLYVLNELEMRKRLFCDLIKDAFATSSSLNMHKFKNMLIQIYCQGNIVTEPTPLSADQIDQLLGSAYDTLLGQLDEKITSNPVIKARITPYINQPKLSTVGSNIKISHATHVFYESGFGSKSICMSSGTPSFKNILTPAAIMDPMGKEKETNEFFPPQGINIVFDKTFTKRLGFPDTLWGCFDTPGYKQVSIQYTQVKGEPQEILNHSFIPTTTKDDVKVGEFGQYIKGNNEKNQELANLVDLMVAAHAAQNPTKFAASIKEVIKILETKELGDVAQVWLYLAYIIEKGIGREEALMITTDSVVYLFCLLLNLSCAYTGSRAGVLSKNCSIYHYIAGTPNYQLKITNMTTNAYDIMAQKIASQKYIMALVAADMTLTQFSYMRIYRGKLTEARGYIDETTSYHNLSADRKKGIIQIFKTELQKLETNATQLVQKKAEFDTYLATTNHTNDEKVMTTYNSFTDSISEFECKLYFTKLQTGKYLLQEDLRNQLYPRWNNPAINAGLGGGSSIGEFNYMTSETSSSKFLSEEKIYVGGEIGIKGTIEDGITLLEAIILIYTYKELVTANFISKLIQQEFFEEEISLFAITYDKYAYNIDDDEYDMMYTSMIKQPLSKYQTDIILSEENIIVIGVVLSNYVYFAYNFNVELLLQQNLDYQRVTRSSIVPIFIPNTACDGTVDPIANMTIPIGTGINIFEVCYTTHTLVRQLVEIYQSNQYSSSINLFEVLFEVLFKNLFNISLQNMQYYHGNTFEAVISNSQEINKILKALCNIFAFIYTYYSELYLSLSNMIPVEGVSMLGYQIKKDTDGLIKFVSPTDPNHLTFRFEGGSNKYLFKKIKSKKNRLKKIKSKKNRLKKIKSKQHRLKKIKSKKFTRKNKKSKDGVI